MSFGSIRAYTGIPGPTTSPTLLYFFATLPSMGLMSLQYLRSSSAFFNFSLSAFIWASISAICFFNSSMLFLFALISNISFSEIESCFLSADNFFKSAFLCLILDISSVSILSYVLFATAPFK